MSAPLLRDLPPLGLAELTDAIDELERREGDAFVYPEPVRRLIATLQAWNMDGFREGLDRAFELAEQAETRQQNDHGAANTGGAQAVADAIGDELDRIAGKTSR